MTAGGQATLHRTIVPFTAGDGLQCRLVHVVGPDAPTRGPVLLVHGAGTHSNIFTPPLPVTIVDVLIARGYDVWLEDWRASTDLAPNRWTLDQAARFDHPEAVRAVVRATGAREIKALIHCQGSTSFMMSAVAGLVPQVTTIVSNAVSLHTIVPWLSKVKLYCGVPLFRFVSDYMNPQWGREASTWPARFIQLVVRATHHECANPVCKQVSFTYGAGFPSLWSHENLDAGTHDWISDQFGFCSIAFFRQIGRCARAGHLVAFEDLPGLPRDFVADPPKTTARIAFIAGRDNRCFLPESQAQTFAYFDRLRPGVHSLHVLPGYGHLDVFLGRRAAVDVFPLILRELDGAA
jgi:pimeloyl-ACP methyl ester carboxylesterase